MGIDVEEGILTFRNNTTGLGDPTGPMNIESNATFFMNNGFVTAAKKYHFKDGSELRSQGSLNTMDGSVQLSGTVDFDMGGFLKIAGTITGSGGINKIGSSRVTFTSTNSYSGLTYIDNGQIFLGDGTPEGSLGSGSVVMDFNTTIGVNRTTDASILNSITGNGIIQLYGNTCAEFGFVNMVHSSSIILVSAFSGQEARLNVTTNSDITITRLYTANQFGAEGHILQTGGSLTVTDFTFIPEFRLAYQGGTNSTYDMQGGMLHVPMGGIAVGHNGHGIWNITGGTACVDRVAVNYFAPVGEGTLNLGGGVVHVGAGGITNQGAVYTVNFTGGTLRAGSTNVEVSVDVTLENTTVIDSLCSNILMSGSLSGGGGIRKIGDGTLHITGDHTFTGDLEVDEGTLLWEGDHTGAGTYIISNASVMTGNGSTDADVAIDAAATLAPEPALTIEGDLSVYGTCAFDVSGATIDQVLDIDNLNLNTGSVITVSGALSDTNYVVMTYSARTGIFEDVSSVTGQGYDVIYDDIAGEVRLVPHEPPEITIELDDAGFTVFWHSFYGYNYGLEYSTNLLLAEWLALVPYTNIAGIANDLSITNLLPDPNAAFFQVVEE